jgi:hypothetical protein
MVGVELDADRCGEVLMASTVMFRSGSSVNLEEFKNMLLKE